MVAATTRRLLALAPTALTRDFRADRLDCKDGIDHQENPPCLAEHLAPRCSEHSWLPATPRDHRDSRHPKDAALLADNPPPAVPDVSPLMEMPHETMLARWQQGLVTPMSSTINTFVKTDGTWWTASQDMWQRVPQVEGNERLDYHHARFESVHQAQGPATTTSPWYLANAGV
jgi:hypothetical protein